MRTNADGLPFVTQIWLKTSQSSPDIKSDSLVLLSDFPKYITVEHVDLGSFGYHLGNSTYRLCSGVNKNIFNCLAYSQRSRTLCLFTEYCMTETMRFFVNKFTDYVPSSIVKTDSKQWKERVESILKQISQKWEATEGNSDGGLYVGNAGVGYAFYYVATSGLFDEKKDDYIDLSMKYSKASLDYAKNRRFREPPCSFILGEAGSVSLAALLFQEIGDIQRSERYSKQFESFEQYCRKIDFYKYGSDELFMGRAGYLSGILALRQKLGNKVVAEDVVKNLCTITVESGRQYVYSHYRKSSFKPPLMYAYHETEYLGAAHGLSSILQMLLSFPEFYASELEQTAVMDVKAAVDFMLSLENRLHNYVPAMDEVGSSARPESEELVHWCHGAPGVVYMFARAYKVWGDEKYLQACLRCGELTWQRGLLRKGPGICHGVAGSGYVFLLLHRLTGDPKHLYRAEKFAEFLFTEEFKRGARVPDSPYSLYEGWAGTALFLVDLMQPDKAEFPLFNVVF